MKELVVLNGNLCRIIIAVAIVAFVAGPAAAQSPSVVGAEKSVDRVVARPTTITAPDAPNLSSRYVLGIGDELVIHAVDVPEISERPQRIDPDGDLRLAIVGRVNAAGMTVADLERELKKRLSVFLQEPDVTITITSSRSQSVSVLGAVAQPGLRPLDTSKTLMDVLSAAGGPSTDAGPTVRVVRRLDQGAIPIPEATTDRANGFSIVEIDARALLDGRTPEKNITMLPNDVVAVPRADVLYVIGEVGRPGPLPLTGTHAMTVMEAVSTSGGVLKTAASNRTRILRRVPGQETRLEINIDLRKMMQGQAKDVPMQVGDILVVPDSAGKKMTTRAIEVAIQMGTMLGTYGIVH